MGQKRKAADLLDWLGIRDAPDWSVARPLGKLAGTVLVVMVPVLFVGALLAAGAVVLHTIGLDVPGSDQGTNLGAGALIAAILGAPFIIWAIWLRQRGTAIQHRLAELSDASLFNDKINAAVESLYSRRQVTRVVLHDEKETVLTEWQDDVLKRSAAIDRLEGLARERPSETPRIAAMLSIYVRELSRDYPAKEHPRQNWQALVDREDGSRRMSEADALTKLGLNSDDITIEALQIWARALQPCRADLEKAAQTLGKLLDIPGVVVGDINIDLRGATLQGFDLRHLRFGAANLANARMEGANLEAARMQGAILQQARMESAALRHAGMEGANLTGARLEGADLWLARMVGATLTGTQMQRANLEMARMEGANIGQARMEGATLRYASMEGARLRLQNLSAVIDLTPDQIASTFGDASVTLPGGVAPGHPAWPAHWPIQALARSYFNMEWDRWKANPAAYIPPPPPA